MEPKTVSIDEIKLWNVKALQDFLRKRNLKVSARKEELVALVFAALQMPEYASPRTSDCQKESAKENAYRDLLQTSHGTLPDPNLLPDVEWESEAKAIQKWPQTMAFDIGIYLQSIDDVPLRARLMSDYKDGKAFSYFASGWVKEIFFHNIHATSQYCFLKSQCRPSQALSNLPWKVWVAFHKRTGRIHSAFCTCFAGYSGACNHVAAILFKVDFAWRNGLTNPACTSRECEWAAFGTKQKVKPKRICEMTWSKPKFSKSGISGNEEGINTETRQLFSPSGTCETQSRPILPNLVSALLPNFTDACAFTYCSEYIQADATTVNFQPWEDVNVGQYEEVEFVELPLPLVDLADNATSLEGFLDAIPTYSYETVGELERCTRGQVSNDTWFLHRKGRITGSVVHSVVTRSRRLMSESSAIDNTSLIKRLLYNTVSPDIPALKYGREMEAEARLNYIKIMRAFGHPSLIVDECGLFVDSEQVYLGASPDGLVHCECCGKGPLEIKCPLSVSHTIPDSSNLSYIVEVDEKMTLKTSHQYYTQVQLQMGITKALWCDFFVYSRHGYIRIRVNFNEEMWTEIKECSEHFFKHHLAKEMVTKDILSHILKSHVK